MCQPPLPARHPYHDVKGVCPAQSASQVSDRVGSYHLFHETTEKQSYSVGL
jgi:hypothetical protein